MDALCSAHFWIICLSQRGFSPTLRQRRLFQGGREERVKGYKVKVQYQALEEGEKKARREAIAQVILQSLRRQREKV